MTKQTQTVHPLDLVGKSVLVTGASSGIGEATARHLARRGARVFLGARRLDRLQQLAAEIQSTGGIAHARALDVTDPKSMEQFFASALEQFGRVDVLVNNAGVMPLGRLAALELDSWNRMIDVNIRGVLHGIASALPRMEAQGDGHIINVASVASRWVGPTSAVYSATKFAVWAISDGLRQETSKVRVTTISPGVTQTELGHDIGDPGTREFLKTLREEALDSEAIAHAIAYAIGQPANVAVNEIVVRPLGSSI